MNLAFMSDGGSHKNKCSIGIYVIDTDSKKVVGEVSKIIGEGNHVSAEWFAIIESLKLAIKMSQHLKIDSAVFLMDSYICVNQIKGSAKCNAYKAQLSQVLELARKFKEIVPKSKLDYIQREFNHNADALSSEAREREKELEATTKYPFLAKR